MKSLATTAFDARKVTDKRLIELITEYKQTSLSYSEMATALKLLRQDSQVTVPMIKRLMSTGTPKAREMVANVMRRNFTFITEAQKYEENDPNWKWRVELVWNPTLAQDLFRTWVLGNVLDEVGVACEEFLLIAGVDAAASGINNSGFPSALQKGSEAYWRGLSAFFLSKVVYRNSKELRARAQFKARYDFYGEVDEFIEWAGKHKDISAVIETAKERKTINVAALESIMRQGTVTTSLGSGAL